MRIFLCLILALSGWSYLGANDADAQVRTPTARERQATPRTPARLRNRDRAVTVIKSSDIHRTPALSLKANSLNKGISEALVTTGPGNPDSGNMAIQVAPQGKLKAFLTPKNPAMENRAYLSFSFPQTVAIGKSSNHVTYSNQLISGALNYNLNLVKDKKYLIEIMADTGSSNDSFLRHKIGDEETSHELKELHKMINIYRVVLPATSGWVSGLIAESDGGGNHWRIHSVAITELD